MPEMIALARAADSTELLQSLWVGDSLIAKPRAESIGLLGALAGCTQRVRLGVGCMASFPIRDPIVFAYQWATLDEISGGRMQLAVCTGIYPAGGASAREGAPYGITDAQRAGRLEVNIDLCRRLWTEDSVKLRRGNDVVEVSILLRPVQSPCPIWIAANPLPGRFFERALHRVASLADGWMTCCVNETVLAMSVQTVQRYLAEAGRGPEAFPMLAYHNINICDDRESGLAETDRFLQSYYGPVFAPDMVRAWTAAGSPVECVEQLRALAAYGFTDISLRITSWNQQGQFRRLVDEVLPALA